LLDVSFGWENSYLKYGVTVKGIILAAGRGSRMGALTDDLPKCRTVMHGKELIQWQLDAFRGADISEIAVVRGYLAKTFNLNLTYFENPRWFETNMLMSLVAANKWLENETCIVSYSDIVFSANAVERLKRASGNIVLSYDPNWKDLWCMRFENPLSDAETFKIEGNRVIEIGNKATSMEEIEGQYMGLVKYTPKGWKEVCGYLKQHTQNELDAMDMTMLIQGLIGIGVEVRGTPISDQWFEIDSESDLQKYEAIPFSLPKGSSS
jgi:L-glutamine-phosphate cytidylyltransferase